MLAKCCGDRHIADSQATHNSKQITVLVNESAAAIIETSDVHSKELYYSCLRFIPHLPNSKADLVPA